MRDLCERHGALAQILAVEVRAAELGHDVVQVRACADHRSACQEQGVRNVCSQKQDIEPHGERTACKASEATQKNRMKEVTFFEERHDARFSFARDALQRNNRLPALCWREQVNPNCRTESAPETAAPRMKSS